MAFCILMDLSNFIFAESSPDSPVSLFSLFRDLETKLATSISVKPAGYTHFQAFDDLSSCEGPLFGFAQAGKRTVN